jgi:hypothetical protein
MNGGYLFEIIKEQTLNLGFWDIMSIIFSWKGIMLLVKLSIALSIHGAIIGGFLWLCTLCCCGFIAGKFGKKRGE